VHERPHPRPVAADGEAPLAQHLDVLAALLERRAGPVEPAVAQHDPAALRDRRLEVADRLQRLARVGRRLAVERVVLGLDRPALPGGRPAGEALPDEPRVAGGRDQVVGPLGAEPVGRGERLVEAAAELEPGERGELVHDDVGPRGGHGLAYGGRVERVEDDGLGAERPHDVGIRARGAGHVVPAGEELRDEAAAERAGRAGEEDA
jgi:hypothetical protein